jgi:hypothetical protein
MNRYLRVGFIGAICFAGGWITGQFGTWRAHAQVGRAKDVPPFTNLLGYELTVRQPGEKDFTKDSTIVELEVYKDNVNGNLVYVTGAGAISVVPAPAPK